MAIVLLVGLPIAGVVAYGLWMADRLAVISLWPRARRRTARLPIAEAQESQGSRSGTLG